MGGSGQRLRGVWAKNEVVWAKNEGVWAKKDGVWAKNGGVWAKSWEGSAGPCTTWGGGYKASGVAGEPWRTP